MAKKNVRVEIPKAKPDKLIELAKLVSAKHVLDGVASPLNGLDMATFNTNLTEAEQKNAKAKQLAKDSEEAFEDRDIALGIGEDQTSTTPGTVYSSLTAVRDTLLGKFKGKDQKLGEWGFKVDTSSPGPKPKPPVP